MKTFIIFCTLCIGFVGGIVWEKTTTNISIDDIEQVAKDACDVRIKVIKETCKK